MPSDFKAIEEYLLQCERIRLEEAISPDTSSLTDQKVPQYTPSADIIGEDKMLSQSSKYALQVNNDFQHDFYGVRLPSLSSVPSTHVIDIMSDQQLTCEENHKLLDLDTLGAQDYDDTFYDDVSIKIKSEPISSYGDDTYTPYCSDSPSSPGDSNGLDCSYSEMVSVENFLINHIKREIETTCTQLNISPDPNSWLPEHTRKWLVRTLQQYNKPIANMNSLYMDGARLCLLKEEEFNYRCPESGSVLFSQLDLWKSACMLVEPFSSSPVHQTSYYGGAASPNQSPIYQPVYQELVSRPVPSVSPTPSNSSVDAVSSSSQSMDEEFGLNFGYKLAEPEREPRQTIHLWQFLRELLLKAHTYGNCIKWIDRTQGIFKIEDSTRVAKLWGQRKNRPAMNYDKLSRSIRQYYKKGIIKKTEHSKRLVYQFCKPYLLNNSHRA